MRIEDLVCLRIPGMRRFAALPYAWEFVIKILQLHSVD